MTICSRCFFVVIVVWGRPASSPSSQTSKFEGATSPPLVSLDCWDHSCYFVTYVVQCLVPVPATALVGSLSSCFEGIFTKERVCCCQCWTTWLLSGTPLAGVFKGTIIHYSMTWFCAGIDFKLKTFTVQGKRIRLQIWWACAWLMSSLIALGDE